MFLSMVSLPWLAVAHALQSLMTSGATSGYVTLPLVSPPMWCCVVGVVVGAVVSCCAGEGASWL